MQSGFGLTQDLEKTRSVTLVTVSETAYTQKECSRYLHETQLVPSILARSLEHLQTRDAPQEVVWRFQKL